MEKKCFIILPPGDPDGYAKGHINRVYQYLIVPACKQAGFIPARVGDPNIDDTPLGIIATMIESDIVLCDLTSNHPHALYGFALRQALGLPITLMKDIKTSLSANIPEFDLVEYDESLRIDTVQTEIETLSDALKKSADQKGAPHELLSRLNIGAAAAEPSVNFVNAESSATGQPSDDTDLKEVHLPFISPLPDFVGEPLSQHEIDHLNAGDFFFHRNYGKGEILTINTKTKDRLMKIRFDSGTKLLVLMASDIFRKINR